jgi:hypothetical protein
MTAAKLTEAMITAAMAKAEARTCTGADRCYALPSDVETARARCTPQGRCRVGLIVSQGTSSVSATRNPSEPRPRLVFDGLPCT